MTMYTRVIVILGTKYINSTHCITKTKTKYKQIQINNTKTQTLLDIYDSVKMCMTLELMFSYLVKILKRFKTSSISCYIRMTTSHTVTPQCVGKGRKVARGEGWMCRI